MERILELLYEIRPEIDFASTTNYIDQHLLDSLDIVMLISDIEEAYGIKIDVDDILPENFNTLEAILNLIERRGGQI